MPNSSVQYESSYRGLGSLKKFSVILKNVDSSISVDITSLVIDFSIYEDIFSKTLYGDVSIKDSVNLLNGSTQLGNAVGFPIVGEEYIEVTYSVLGLTDPEEYTKRFAVYSIKNLKVEANLKTKNYVLQFCSEEHLIDSTTLIQKSYKDIQISDMVESVLKDYLQVDKSFNGGKKTKNYVIQKTRGNQHIVVPRLSPFETLDLFARRSIAEKNFESASYLFFENKDGFNFCDIEYLIQKGRQQHRDSFNVYRYFYNNPQMSGAHEDSDVAAFKNILRLTQKHKFDTIEKIRRGYFESEVVEFNLTDRSVSPTTFKFLDNYNKYNTLGNPDTGGNISFPENSVDFIRNVTESPSSQPKILGIFDFTKNNPPGKHTKVFFIPKDGTKPETYLKDIYTNRASYMTRLAQNMYTADVYGDPRIGAGDIISVDIHEYSGTTTEHVDLDKYASGYYLVTSIHHRFTADSYMCTYDLFKNGFSAPVVSRDTDEKPAPANPFPTEIKLDELTITGPR